MIDILALPDVERSQSGPRTDPYGRDIIFHGSDRLQFFLLLTPAMSDPLHSTLCQHCDSVVAAPLSEWLTSHSGKALHYASDKESVNMPEIKAQEAATCLCSGHSCNHYAS